MNDELEQLLLDQPLRKPSRSLDARISRLLSDESHRWRSMALGFVPAALAASVAMALLIQPESPPQKIGERPTLAHGLLDELQRIDQVQTTYTPGEIMVTPSNEPIQPIRLQSLHKTRWFNEGSNTYIERTVPEDEVLFVAAPVY